MHTIFLASSTSEIPAMLVILIRAVNHTVYGSRQVVWDSVAWKCQACHLEMHSKPGTDFSNMGAFTTVM